MPYSIWNDPKTWRQRAEEARALADVMSDSGARENMLKIAESYEEMAKKAEERPIIPARPQKP